MMTETEQMALDTVRPELLRGADDAELVWLWRKLDQWHGLAKSAGDDAAAHEVAAGFVIQEAAGRGLELPTCELVELAKARCTLAARLDLVPDHILLEDDYAEILCCQNGQLHIYGCFAAKPDREMLADVLADVGIPASPAMEQWEEGDTFAPVYDLALVRSSPVQKQAPAPEYLSKAQAHDGAMVCIQLPGVMQDAMGGAGLLSLPGVEPDNLHLTLLYLGGATDLDNRARQAVVNRVFAVCQEHRPLRMELSGAGYFGGGPDGFPVYASVSAVGLSLLQADLERAVGGVIDLPSVHGWAPHVTLGYAQDVDAIEELPAVELLDLPGWTAQNVSVVAADQLLAVCPLQGHAPIAKPAWSQPGEPEEPMAQATRIACSADDKQIIYYLVSEPETVDAHGHRIKAQDIEDALHGYMAGQRKVKLEHGKEEGLVRQLGRKDIPGKAIVVEGFIAPQELTEFHGALPPDGPIAKGSSIVGIHYTDAGLWRQLKATDHGISWGGYARKVNR